MYGKLFSQMYDGTLAMRGPWQALVTFQQMVILANRHGEVDMTADALSRRTTIPIEIISEGIHRLLEPDPDSRSPVEEGRRIVPMDPARNWGWRIVNYERYRNIRSEEERRDYWRKWKSEDRARKKVHAVPGKSIQGPQQSTMSIQADAEAEVEVEVVVRSNPLVTDVTGVSVEPTTKGSATRVTDTPTRVTDTPSHLNGAFDAFWSAYPKKSSKLDAVRAWKKVREGDVAAVMVGLLRDKASEQWARGVIPHPASWLNKRRWEDEVLAPPTKLRQAFGQCMWNVHGDRDPREERCDRPGFSERDRVVYCEQHAHLHGERVR